MNAYVLNFDVREKILYACVSQSNGQHGAMFQTQLLEP